MFQLVLPDIGEGVVEAEIQKWFVAPGDEVVEDQPLVEVMTDKATVTIPSPRRGKVAKLLYAEGQVAKVHSPLLELELAAASPPSPRPSPPAARGEKELSASFPSAAATPTSTPTSTSTATATATSAVHAERSDCEAGA